MVDGRRGSCHRRLPLEECSQQHQPRLSALVPSAMPRSAPAIGMAASRRSCSGRTLRSCSIDRRSAASSCGAAARGGDAAEAMQGRLPPRASARSSSRAASASSPSCRSSAWPRQVVGCGPQRLRPAAHLLRCRFLLSVGSQISSRSARSQKREDCQDHDDHADDVEDTVPGSHACHHNLYARSLRARHGIYRVGRPCLPKTEPAPASE